jgi:hypothetical protein
MNRIRRSNESKGVSLVNSLFRVFVFLTFLPVCSQLSSDGGEITFTFDYDSSFTTAAGANVALAQSDFTYVGSYLSSVIKTSGAYDITMKFTISGEVDPGSSQLGSAGSDFRGTSNKFNKTDTQAFAQTGTNPAGAGNPVGDAIFNFGKSWGFNGSVSDSQIDFRYVVLHEMTHAMGFIGLIGPTGGTTVASPPGFHGYMDQFFYGWDGDSYEKLVQTSGSNLVAMTNAAAAVVDNVRPLQFRGPNVLNYLGNSTGQDMYTPSTFRSGSSIYHVNIVNDLMYYAIEQGPKTFGYSGLHLAFLQDLGYTVVPEPSTYAFAAVTVIVLAALGRSKSASASRRSERIAA